MFELEDEKLGKLKVVNVTEARANIAAIMNDKEFNYVITKNNRPIRVIINYDLYKKNQAVSSLTQSTLLRPTMVSKPLEAKGSIKGLLSAKEKELKRQATKQLIEPPETSTQEVTSLTPDENLLSKVTTEKNKPVIPQASLEIDHNLEAGSDADADLTEINKSHEILKPEESIEVPSLEKTVSEKSKEETPVFKPHVPPPNSDYFTRFKKLYEAPRHGPLFQNHSSSQTSENSGNFSYSVSKKSSFTHEAAPSPRETRSLLSSSPPNEEKILSSPERIREAVKPKEELPISKAAELPSIQDLLKELEEERLSGEDEELLNDNQVNHLMNRISKS